MTLIEVIVALVILVVMTTVSWEVLSSSIVINDLLSRSDESARSARVVLSTLRRELQLAYLTSNREAELTYRTVFVGEDDNPDSLYFASLSHQRIYTDSRECDQTEITIWGESMPSDRGSGTVVFHRESQRIDERPDEDGRIYPLAYNVRSFNLRYLDQTLDKWVEEWDSRAAETLDRLPRAVQIALVLLGPDPENPDDLVELPYFTTVVLEYSDPMPPSMFSDGGGGEGALGMEAQQ
jgi:type II secretory pathway pseudopilin PulG